MKDINYVVTLFEAQPENSKITIAFTMAVNAARQGLTPVIILMGDAVQLGTPGSIEAIEIGAPFGTGQALLDELLQKGGKVVVCESCMLYKDLQASDMDERFPVIKGSNVIELTVQSKGSVQVS